MKNKINLIFSIILSVVSLILLFIGVIFNLSLAALSFIVLLIGIYMIMKWSTLNYKWICDECKTSFDITLKENVFSINAGVNYKRLYCPNCKKKNYCKGILK